MTQVEPPQPGTGLRSSTVPPGPISWPAGVTAAACLTFDMDAEAAVLTADISSVGRMSPMSHQSYGPLVGVPRILALLKRHDLRATFFIPGYSAHRYPDVVRAVAEAGHEIAHHSYFHENTIGMDAKTEADMLDLGLRALREVAGVRPEGYRAPMWEMNFHTPALLAERGFRYDSSLMDSDHPYVLAVDGGASLVEVPVSWGLDDWEQYAFLPDLIGSGVIESPAKALEMWTLTSNSLGQRPVRDFKFRSAFGLSFADLSPIVGIYTVFAIGLIAAGPAFLWAFPLVLIGQLMVCGVFGNLVSKWPLQGSVYAWSRELVGPRYGWFTGWAYMWGLTLTLAVLPITAAPYILSAAGVNAPSQIVVELVGIGVLLFGSIANALGGRLLRGLIYIALACELIASAGIGITLLAFHHINPLSIIFSGGGTAHGASWLVGPFLLPVAYIAYSFIGFEASASIGEEVQESRKVLPKAVVLSLAVGGVLVIIACLGIVLAIPDVSAAVSGKDTNPIATTLVHAYGSGSGRTLLIALAIGFTSSMIAVQTAVTRAIWASARDRLLPGTRVLGKLSGREHLPRYAIGLTVIIAGALVFAGASKIFALLVSFSAFGFILSYYLPIIALGYKQWRGQSPTADGWGARWIRVITAIAVVWLTAEIVNLLWPRDVNSEWYLNWGAIIMTGVLGVLGLLICLRSFRPGSPAMMAQRTDVVAAEEES